MVTEPAPEVPTEVVVQRPSIASQLSDAIAQFLYAAFDDVAKSLVARLQSADKTLATPPETPPPAPLLPQGPIEVRVIELPPPKEEAPPPPPPPPPPSPAFDIPYPRNQSFVGRFNALAQLFGMWKPGQNGRITVVGLGGIG
jgi:hypothetical protein